MKLFARYSFPILILLFVLGIHPAALRADDGIHPRGAAPADGSAPPATPAENPNKVVLGTVEVSGEIIPQNPQVFLRGQTGSTQVTVLVPTEAFAVGNLLDHEALPAAVGKNVILTLREFEIDGSLHGESTIMARGGADDRRTGDVLDLPTRTASITILMLAGADNQVRARVHYLFEESIQYRAVSYSELNFVVYPEGLQATYKGEVQGSGSLDQAQSEETVQLAFSGEGLGKGTAQVSVSPVAFATGKLLDLAKIQSGSSLEACANQVPATVTYGSESRDRVGNFKVTLKKDESDPGKLSAKLDYDFRSIYPAQEVKLDLKSEDLKPCYMVAVMEQPAAIAVTIPEYEEPEGRVDGEPVEPELPADGTGPEVPPDGGTPGTVEEAPAGTVTNGGSDFRPEHFVTDSDQRGPVNANGAGVSGGSKGLACALHAGASPVDLSLILVFLGALIPGLRAWRKSGANIA